MQKDLLTPNPSPKEKGVLVAASLAGLTAVIFGAFGAHSLRALISPEHVVIWDKGVQYQFYHALALLGCALYLRSEPSKLIRNAAICFIVGILGFSGSLYLLSTTELTHIPTIIIGPITPLGGLFFIAGWSFLLYQAVKTSR